jgi:hypothetical protein
VPEGARRRAMGNIKQYLYETFIEEFNNTPTFLLARSFYLFCHYNPAFELPNNVRQKFIAGLEKDEVRAFSLRYQTSENGSGEGESSPVKEKGKTGSLEEMKKEIYKEIAAENLSRGTGKTYSPSMVEKITAKYRSVLSYNEILEIFIMSGR